MLIRTDDFAGRSGGLNMTKQIISKRHHIVPKFLLNRFTNEDGKLWVLNKSAMRFYAQSPSDALVQSHLNTAVSPDGTRDASLEDFYSRLEGLFAPVVDKIVICARKRQLPNLSKEEVLVWAFCLYHQHKRAPDAFLRLPDLASMISDWPAYLDQFETKHGPFEAADRARLERLDARERIVQGATVNARGRNNIEIISLLASKGLTIAIVDDPSKKSFITGDHPVVRMAGPSGSVHLADPNMEAWLPISSDVAVSPGNGHEKEQLIAVSGNEVRRVNLTLFNQSNIVAARSDKLLHSLSKAR